MTPGLAGRTCGRKTGVCDGDWANANAYADCVFAHGEEVPGTDGGDNKASFGYSKSISSIKNRCRVSSTNGGGVDPAMALED